VYAVDVLAVEIGIRFGDLPGMVLLDHRHPLAGGLVGDGASVDLPSVDQDVAAIELFRHYDRTPDKAFRIRVNRVAAADGWGIRPVGRAWVLQPIRRHGRGGFFD